MDSSDPELPPNSDFYSLQIAGHKFADGTTELGLLKHQNGNILKPLREGDKRGESELNFYRNIFDANQTDLMINELRSFLPAFRGTWTTEIGRQTVKYLCLEDICDGFQNPSVLDIKMGSVTHDPEANEEKILYEKSKNPYGEIIGFRILGMKVYKEADNSYFTLDKQFGKLLTPDTICSGLRLFLSNQRLTNCILLCGFLHRIAEICAWFEKQRLFAVYASSILFAYEGSLYHWTEWCRKNEWIQKFPDSPRSENHMHNCDDDFLKYISTGLAICKPCVICGLDSNICDKIRNECSLFRAAMIDFAHVFPSKEKDLNYIFGLNRLTEYFQTFLKDEAKIICTKNNLEDKDSER